MFSGLKNLFLGSGSSSKSLAKSRLQFVLVQDRTGLVPDELTAFKKEMLGVIEKYFVVDLKGFDISYDRSGDMTKLVINSPVVVRRQDSKDGSAGARGRGARNRMRKQAANGPELSAGDSEETGL